MEVLMSGYVDEIAFLERKLATKRIQWKAIVPLEQIASTGLTKFEALEAVNRLEMQFKEKCNKQQNPFANIVSIAKETVVIIKVPALREVFADEIDGFSGGGGRKNRVRPLQTTLGRR